MSPTPKSTPPVACGLYRTTTALPGREDAVPAGRLVYYHNHSDEGPPLVLLPAANAHNRWTFQERGYLASDPDYPATLEPLPKEGLYVMRSHFHPTGGVVVAERTLVQLGYNTAGDPILFVPVVEGNAIRFPATGYRFETRGILSEMEPAGFVLPKQPADEPSGRLLH